ncbi:MAG TPA: serine/threonine-protein kinase [Candidatus Limnocylindria bacterium]|nr:serine/threonine-protein kinase [Candidatus Limnocylindria bacterium]
MPSTPESLHGERFIPGRIISGRYRVVGRVGQGGMGEVFRADDLKLGQPVALKFLPQELSGDPTRLEALFAEVRLARQVSHAGVCRVHDIGEMDGMHFLSMEFVDGEDLASLLRRIGRLPADKAIEIAREICAALAAVHGRGVLHRDLKPANLMIDGRGHVRITDFGLAELQGTGVDPEFIVGTPAYMAPECLAGGQATTVRSDLYSLGLVMYELFTGRHAFEAKTIQEMIHLSRETVPVSPAKHQRDIDPKVEQVILRCLERDPEHRPSSALAVAAALPGGDPIAAALAAGETPSPALVAAPTTGVEGLRPAAAWSFLVAILAGLLLVTAVAPRTRLVPALSLPETPEAMAGRARELLRDLGMTATAVDRASGYEYDESIVDGVTVRDRSPSRWGRLSRTHPQVVTFWYRESPAELVPAGPRYRVTYSDPPLALGGMVGVKLDGLGRLRRLDAPASASAAAATLDPSLLFRAAGLEPADFQAVAPRAAPPGAGDLHLAYAGVDRENPPRPLHVEVVAFRGRPVSFVVEELGMPLAGAPAVILDPSGRTTALIFGSVRPALLLATLLIGAWLARRNLRAGRGDTKRAFRVGLGLMTLRIVAWLLGGHHTVGSLTYQLMSALAWGLYDFAYGWVIYMAIEPKVRRLWPRLLTSWARLLDGQHADARVGRDVLIGCLVGTVIALAVAGHQAAPALFGAPPGRPDNVGYVENELTALLGLRHQLADLLGLFRSNLVLVMGFVAILIIARLALRNTKAAVVTAFLIFVPLALPKGEMLALNLAFAICVSLLLLLALMRFGLLAAGVAMLTHAALQSAPLGMGIGSWTTSQTVLVLGLVLGVAGYGFVRSLGRWPAFRDVLAEE